MKRYRFIWLVYGVACIIFLIYGQAQAKYPDRTIELVIPYSPGGQSDVITRIFTPKLIEHLKAQITLVNRGGAGGLKGVSYVARAKKDGYVLLSGAQGPVVAMPLMSAEATVDPLKELLPLGLFGSAPSIFTVRSDSPFKSLKDLEEYARKNPGKLKNAGSSAAASGQLNVTFLCTSKNIDITSIPFKGGGESLVALLGGHVDMFCAGPGSVGVQIKAGSLRALAVTSRKRHPDFPDVPTTAELGYPHLNMVGWVGLFAPSGIPQSVRNVLIPAVEKAFKDPAAIAQARKTYFMGDYMGPAEFGKSLVSEMQRVEKIVKALGLKDK